jgi:hypothetical protein
MLVLHVDGAAVAGDPVTTFGKVTFVDLAGSERLKQSKSTGGTMKETGNINRSLMALGKVITALSEAGTFPSIPAFDLFLTGSTLP